MSEAGDVTGVRAVGEADAAHLRRGGLVDQQGRRRRAGQHRVRLAALALVARAFALFLQSVDAHALDAARIGIEDFEFERPRSGTNSPRTGTRPTSVTI